MGVVDEKKGTLGRQNVLMQGERYARGFLGSPFDFGGLRIPFLYPTNSEVVWFHVRHLLNRARRVALFCHAERPSPSGRHLLCSLTPPWNIMPPVGV